jgi:DNA (cytosine-5)-methyltransferase 1
MRYGSVCSGVEAASLAWEPLGWECAFVSEIEKFPAAVLAHHYPNVPNLGDMTAHDFADRCLEQGPINVLVGGTPCQSFSVAGLRGGLDDERGNLALEFCRLTDRLAPTWVVWENVPGVLSSGGGRDFGSIVGALGQLGYNLAWRILDAQHFGVPQRRRRVFLVGHLGAEQRGAAAVLFESHSLQGHPAPSREAREDLAPTVSAGAPFSRTGNERVEAQELVPVTANTLGSRGTRSHTEIDGHVRPVPIEVYQSNQHHNPQTVETVNLTTNNAAHIRGDSIMATQPIWRGSDQANAETVEGQAGTLNCNKGQQGGIVALPYFRATGRSSYTEAESAERLRACAAKQGDTDLICVNARETPVSASGKSLPLGAQDRGHAIGFIPKNSEKTRSMGEQAEMSPTLDSSPHAVAFAQNTRDEANLISGDGQITGALAAEPGMKQQTYVFEPGNLKRRCGSDPNETTAPKVGAGKLGDTFPHIATEMQVRRLTPRECERLQGMPDDWTKIPWRGKPAEDCPDGPRYKAIGNSMAVPVMRWIGERIAMVDEIYQCKR